MLATAAFAAAAMSVPAQVTLASPAPPYKVGDRIANFHLLSDKGRSISLAHYRGRVVVLAFYASWCPPCNTEAPKLEKQVWRAFRKDGVEVLGVAVEEADRGKLRPLAGFLRRHHLSYTLVSDARGKLLDRFGFEGIPELVVIDGAGLYRANPPDVDAAVATIRKLIAERASRSGKRRAKAAARPHG